MNVATIKATVKELLELADIHTYPVNVQKIADILQISVQRGHLDDNLAGFAYQKGGVKIIGVNSSESETRQRFTLAHELGHMMLHKQETVNYDQELILMRDVRASMGTDVKEIDANRFAAELLMPENELAEDLKNNSLPDMLSDHYEDSAGFKKLCAKYGVGTAAMKIRLASIYFN